MVNPTGPGQEAVPDAFIAEGGITGDPTFIGCVGTGPTTTALVRTDTSAAVIGTNVMLPFNCTYNSEISDKSASGFRWLFERGTGAFAFDGVPFTGAAHVWDAYNDDLYYLIDGTRIIRHSLSANSDTVVADYAGRFTFINSGGSSGVTAGSAASGAPPPSRYAS